MTDLLIVVSTLGIGGNKTSAVHIYNALKKKLNVKLVAVDGSSFYMHGLNHDEIIDLHSKASHSVIKKIINSICRVSRLNKLISEYKPKYVYLFTSPYSMLTLVRFRHTKTMIVCRDYGKLEKFCFLFKKNLSKHDYMICNSDYQMKYYLSKYPSDKDKVLCIPNIVDTELIDIKSNAPLDKDAESFFSSHRVIVSVGRFCEEKGFNHLVRAFLYARRYVDNLGLCIVGDGKLMSDIQSLIKLSGASQDIFLPGYKENPYCFMKKGDMFVLSSVTEGLPNVILEALALNKPVIATDCKSGPREILTQNISAFLTQNCTFLNADYGILCPPFDRSDDYTSIDSSFEEMQMGKAIIELYTNTDLYNEYSQKSVSIMPRFSPHNIALQYIKLLGR